MDKINFSNSSTMAQQVLSDACRPMHAPPHLREAAAAAFTTRAHSHMSPSRHLDEVEDDELDFALPTSTRRKSWLGSVCCCFSGGDERRLSL